MLILQAIRHSYHKLLHEQGISVDPAKRTVEQQITASLLYWSVMFEVNSMTTLTQEALEK